MDFDLIVVGGGPAGMLGAAAAGAKGLRVVLLEKNDRLGKKLSLTGNGRCNVTNYGDFEDYQSHIVTNRKFLYSALRAFDNRRLTGLLRELGVRIRVEDRGRVFPASNSAGDVIKALQKHLEQNRVEVRFCSEVVRVLAGDGRVRGVLLGDNVGVSGRNVLIATGGASYRYTGSTGDGHRMARELGHRVAGPVPALIPLVTGEPWVGGLQGLSLQDVMARVEDGKRIVAEGRGDLLFTHFGVSGPVILDLSSFLTRQPHFPLNLKVDLLHGLTGPQVEERLQRLFAENPGKSLKNALGASRLAPQRMVPVLLELSGAGGGKQVDQVNRKERGLLARVMKNLALTVLGTRPLNEAIVTGGGIDVREINPSTLESKIMAGLYFAGEILDTDALTGGYNLQIAFSTGYLSGVSAARER